eukprot:3557285-Pleurochrysis_carterae.AAC.1
MIDHTPCDEHVNMLGGPTSMFHLEFGSYSNKIVAISFIGGKKENTGLRRISDASDNYVESPASQIVIAIRKAIFNNITRTRNY